MQLETTKMYSIDPQGFAFVLSYCICCIREPPGEICIYYNVNNTTKFLLVKYTVQ